METEFLSVAASYSNKSLKKAYILWKGIYMSFQIRIIKHFFHFHIIERFYISLQSRKFNGLSSKTRTYQKSDSTQVLFHKYNFKSL